eukprot:449331_1
MGTVCSQVSCSSQCNCFLLDKNIKNVVVARNEKVKWIWTNKHQSTLVAILTDPEYNYNLPTVLVNLIKTLSYSENELFYVRKTHFCEEPHYSKQKQLLKKKLCSTWYHSKLSNLLPFPIVIFSSDPHNSDNCKQSMSNINKYLQGLPTDQISNSRLGCCSMRRILNINHCPIQIDVFKSNIINDNNMDYYIYFNKPIYFILINTNDSMKTVDKICTSIWNKNNSMNNCILVKMSDECNYVQSLSQKWNIPSVSVDYINYRQNSIHNLFKFAIKYYWFCQVAKSTS